MPYSLRLAPGGMTLPRTSMPCRNSAGDETETAARVSVMPKRSSSAPSPAAAIRRRRAGLRLRRLIGMREEIRRRGPALLILRAGQRLIEHADVQHDAEPPGFVDGLQFGEAVVERIRIVAARRRSASSSLVPVSARLPRAV